MVNCTFNEFGKCVVCGYQVDNYKPSIKVTKECFGDEGTPIPLKNRFGRVVHLQNIFLNCSCFFIGGGPSISRQNLEPLTKRGIATFAVNNAGAKLIKPTFWCCVDNPVSFHDVIWNDPTIIKFIPENIACNHFLKARHI